VKQHILDKFDALVSQEEKAATEAWKSSESHPLPPLPPQEDTKSKPPLLPAKNDLAAHEPPRSGSPIPSFPSLAALARTFALPLTGSRQRPRSLDTATAVPSPATLSSFASQQQQPPMPAPPAHHSNPDSGRSTPMSRSRSGESDPTQFDFQRFLDQMKAKSAEPVGKYLRSYVFASRYLRSGL
jgi:Rab5 GDP/GTP exchange factor